jgi:hypothetical protein
MTSPSFECTCILKSFCHFFVNFHKLLHSHLFVQFGLARVWRTRAASFRETCIIRQNGFSRFKCPIWTNNFFPSTKQWRDTYCFSNVIKVHEHFVTIVLMSYTLSKLYVDIKFDMFNMKFKNHLFCQIKVHYIDWLIIYIVIFELLETKV